MSWRDELQPGRYSGVAIQVNGVSVTFGWKAESRSKPVGFAAGSGGQKILEKHGDASVPAVRRTSLQSRKFKVTAHFSGDDYKVTRDAFLKVVERGIPGMLTLPTYDPVLVVPLLGTMVFSDRAGGYESIQMTFMEAGEKTAPTRADATQAVLDAIFVEGSQDIAVETAAAMDVAGFPNYISTSMQIDTESYIDIAREALTKGVAKTTSAFDTTNALINELEDDTLAFVNVPANLAAQITAIQANMASSFGSTQTAFEAQLDIFTAFPTRLTTVVGESANKVAQRTNQLALQILIQGQTLTSAAGVLSDLQFAAVTDALQVNEEFGDAVEALQLTAGDTDGFSETYQSLVQLRAAVFNDLSSRSAVLPRVETTTIPRSVAGIAEAYRRYGDATRYTEFTDRNPQIEQSLFITGEIEVLSN